MAAPPRPVVLEITPPARPRPDVLLRRAGLLAPAVRRVNVIDRVDRWRSVEAAAALLGHGFEPVWHLPNRGRRLADVEAEIERAAAAGLRRVLCVRGEYKADRVPDDEPKIREVVARVRARIPDAAIGVTADPHRPGARALDNLLRKLDAGADFVQTQVGFDGRGLGRLARAVADRHPGVGLVPMLLPVLSPEAARRAARRLAIPLDQALHLALERGGEAAGWSAFAARLAAARRDERFAAVALMTPIDPPPAMAARLRALVDATQ